MAACKAMAAQFDADAAARLAASSWALLTLVTVVTVVLQIKVSVKDICRKQCFSHVSMRGKLSKYTCIDSGKFFLGKND